MGACSNCHGCGVVWNDTDWELCDACNGTGREIVMGIRIGPSRIGHRVGRFYVSAPVGGRNAGRQVRVGHRLPGGSYASVPVRVTESQGQSHPIGSYPWPVLLATTLLYVAVAVALLVAGLWFVAVPILLATLICALQWAAYPQQRRH